MSTSSSEPAITDLRDRVDSSDPQSLVLNLASYQLFDPDKPALTLIYQERDDGLDVVMWNLQPGQCNDYHVHPRTEHLHVVISGEAEYTLAGAAPVRLSPGHAVMVPANVEHGIRNVGARRCSYLAITSPGTYAKVRVPQPRHAVEPNH